MLQETTGITFGLEPAWRYWKGSNCWQAGDVTYGKVATEKMEVERGLTTLHDY